VTLTEFLLARIEERQRRGCRCDCFEGSSRECDELIDAECEAKRRIVREYVHAGDVSELEWESGESGISWDFAAQERGAGVRGQGPRLGVRRPSRLRSEMVARLRCVRWVGYYALWVVLIGAMGWLQSSGGGALVALVAGTALAYGAFRRIEQWREGAVRRGGDTEA
jgi:hypothetical protein